MAKVIEAVKKEIPDRHVDVVVNEYNIAWTWKARDPRMINHKGAVFDALVMASVISHGGAATFAWNDVDGIYGKMSRSYQLRPSAHVYHHLNAGFIGDIVGTVSSNTKAVVPYAVVQKDRAARSLMLVNRSAEPQEVRLRTTGAGWPADTLLRRACVSEEGHTVGELNASILTTEAFKLPPESVTFLLESAHQPSS